MIPTTDPRPLASVSSLPDSRGKSLSTYRPIGLIWQRGIARGAIDGADCQPANQSQPVASKLLATMQASSPPCSCSLCWQGDRMLVLLFNNAGILSIAHPIVTIFLCVMEQTSGCGQICRMFRSFGGRGRPALSTLVGFRVGLCRVDHRGTAFNMQCRQAARPRSSYSQTSTIGATSPGERSSRVSPSAKAARTSSRLEPTISGSAQPKQFPGRQFAYESRTCRESREG